MPWTDPPRRCVEIGVGENRRHGNQKSCGIDDSGVLGEPAEGEHGPWWGRRP